MKHLARVIFVALAHFSTVAHGTMLTSQTVTVAKMFAYTDYGGGDVVFTVSGQTTGCQSGFWLRLSDEGFKTAYAALRVLYATKVPITVSAYDDSLWPGSTRRYCRVFI